MKNARSAVFVSPLPAIRCGFLDEPYEHRDHLLEPGERIVDEVLGRMSVESGDRFPGAGRGTRKGRGTGAGRFLVLLDVVVR